LQFGSSENSARVLYTKHGSEAGSESRVIKVINIDPNHDDGRASGGVITGSSTSST
jgi:hypothetical protein